MKDELAEVERQKGVVNSVVRKQLSRIGECGAWITAQPNMLQGTLLSKDELRDNLRLRYRMCTLSLQH